MKNEVKVLCPACDGRGLIVKNEEVKGAVVWSAEDCTTCAGVGHKVRMAVIGDAATIKVGSDSYAATVVWVSPSAHQIKLQHDKAVATKPTAYTEDQAYICVEDKDGEIEKAQLRAGRNGEQSYSICGKGYQHVTLGIKRPYRDPSF